MFQSSNWDSAIPSLNGKSLTRDVICLVTSTDVGHTCPGGATPGGEEDYLCNSSLPLWFPMLMKIDETQLVFWRRFNGDTIWAGILSCFNVKAEC